MNRDVVVDEPALALGDGGGAVLRHERARVRQHLGELALLLGRLGGDLDLRHGSRREPPAGDDAGATLLLRPLRLIRRLLRRVRHPRRLGILLLLPRLGLVRGLLRGGGGFIRAFLFLFCFLRGGFGGFGGLFLSLELGGVRFQDSLDRRVPRAPPRVHLVQLSLLLLLRGRGGFGVLVDDGPPQFPREPREFRHRALFLLQRPSELELQGFLPDARPRGGGGAAGRGALVLDVARAGYRAEARVSVRQRRPRVAVAGGHLDVLFAVEI